MKNLIAMTILLLLPHPAASQDPASPHEQMVAGVLQFAVDSLGAASAGRIAVYHRLLGAPYESTDHVNRGVEAKRGAFTGTRVEITERRFGFTCDAGGRCTWDTEFDRLFVITAPEFREVSARVTLGYQAPQRHPGALGMEDNSVELEFAREPSGEWVFVRVISWTSR